MPTRNIRSLKGVRSPAPCWVCSIKLHGGYGVEIKVDGNSVIAHSECRYKLLSDPDFANRVDAGE